MSASSSSSSSSSGDAPSKSLHINTGVTAVNSESTVVDSTISGRAKCRTFAHALGWVAFSLSYNVLNTTFAVIYPKVLQALCSTDLQYNQLFSTINFATTLLSSFILPPLGSVVDQLHVIKRHMILSNIVVIFLVLFVFAIGKFPALFPAMPALVTFQRVCNCISYVLVMFCLRYAVMNNNALLPCFQKSEMIVLSSISNFGGFSTILAGLCAMKLWPPDHFIPAGTWGLDVPYWWLLIATCLSASLIALTFLAPSDREGVDFSPPAPGFCTVLKRSVSSLYETVRNGCSNPEYFRCWLMLFSYLFYSTSGTVFTIFVSQVYISVYDLTLSGVVQLNIFFTVFMVMGVVMGIAVDRLFNRICGSNEVPLKPRPVATLVGTTDIRLCTPIPNSERDKDLPFARKPPPLSLEMVSEEDLDPSFPPEQVPLMPSRRTPRPNLSLFVDVVVLLFQNVLFLILLCSVFFFITMKAPYVCSLIGAMYTGFLYSWNASVSRGLMSKLIPPNKKAEFMAYYSSFTYLGISIISGLNILSNTISKKFPQIVFALLMVWTIPSFFFVACLMRDVCRRK